MTEGSRFYENIFVSGGVLLTDDSILKTIEIGNELFYVANLFKGWINYYPVDSVVYYSSTYLLDCDGG